MDYGNRLCSMCGVGLVEVFCLCTSSETFLCTNCIGSHTVKGAGKTHTNWPISQLPYYKIPGYSERLQCRKETYPQVRIQVLQCVQVLDEVIEEFSGSMERAICEAVQYTKQTVIELNQMKVDLSREAQFALEEVERTLMEDKPQLISQYGNVFRELTENLQQFKLFSYSFKKSTPKMLELQCKLCSPADIYLGTQIKPGVTYEGQSREGQKHGFGVETWDGNRYEGYYENGKKQGLGKLMMANGGSYIGDFHEDLIQGRGVHLLPNAESYIGEWKSGKMHGKGIYRWPDRTYIGEYEEGKKQGFGVYETADFKYQGLWLDGKMHGPGVLIRSSGLRQEVEYERGIGEGRCVFNPCLFVYACD